MHYIEESLLEGIRLNDTDTLEYIYKKFYPSIKNFIILNSGTEEDSKDIFQESIIVIYRRLKTQKDFTISCSFKTYMYSISRNLWLKELEKRKTEQAKIKNTEEFESTNCEIQDPVSNPKEERYKLYQNHFLSLSKDCQQVLRLFMDKVSLKEIAKIMGYTSEKYAKKRKYQCKEILVKRIKNDPYYYKSI
ncbi:MAG: sigma-70 family RNA polymerase sigma factor [Bacteroidales bacterium]